MHNERHRNRFWLRPLLRSRLPRPNAAVEKAMNYQENTHHFEAMKEAVLAQRAEALAALKKKESEINSKLAYDWEASESLWSQIKEMFSGQPSPRIFDADRTKLQNEAIRLIVCQDLLKTTIHLNAVEDASIKSMTDRHIPGVKWE